MIYGHGISYLISSLYINESNKIYVIATRFIVYLGYCRSKGFILGSRPPSPWCLQSTKSKSYYYLFLSHPFLDRRLLVFESSTMWAFSWVSSVSRLTFRIHTFPKFCDTVNDKEILIGRETFIRITSLNRCLYFIKEVFY